MLCDFSFSTFVIKLESNLLIKKKKVITSLCDRLGQVRKRYTRFELIFKSRLELKVTVAETIMVEIQDSSSGQLLFSTRVFARFCNQNLV